MRPLRGSTFRSLFHGRLRRFGLGGFDIITAVDGWRHKQRRIGKRPPGTRSRQQSRYGNTYQF